MGGIHPGFSHDAHARRGGGCGFPCRCTSSPRILVPPDCHRGIERWNTSVLFVCLPNTEVNTEGDTEGI